MSGVAGIPLRDKLRVGPGSRSRFFWKLYSTFSLLFLAVTALVSWVCYGRVQATVKELAIDSLRAKAEFLVPEARAVFLHTAGDPIRFERLAEETGTRIALIATGGARLFDSSNDAVDKEAVWETPEVQTALKASYGVMQRASDGTPLLYLAKAVRQANGDVLGVIRLSMSTEKMFTELLRLKQTMAFIACLGAWVALAIGWPLAKKVAVPIHEMVQVAEAMRLGKYEQRVRTLTGDELGRLGDTLNRLGAELTKKISELQRLETVRRDFVANVSHEIKTPLTSIKGYVETLLAGAIEDPVHKVRFLEKIDRNAERLTALVQDLLSLAKIEATEDTLKMQPIDWTQIIQPITQRYEDQAHGKNLRLKVTLPTSPLIVLGDREAMTQILDNLLTNAIKYTPEGGRVSVSLVQKNGWAKLDVEDTGIGIPAEHLDRIFERFYRVDKARSRELGGTGLGLSIVKHLVSAMGGEVGVESAVGVGSKFRIRLKMAG